MQRSFGLLKDDKRKSINQSYSSRFFARDVLIRKNLSNANLFLFLVCYIWVGDISLLIDALAKEYLLGLFNTCDTGSEIHRTASAPPRFCENTAAAMAMDISARNQYT